MKSTGLNDCFAVNSLTMYTYHRFETTCNEFRDNAPLSDKQIDSFVMQFISIVTVRPASQLNPTTISKLKLCSKLRGHEIDRSSSKRYRNDPRYLVPHG